MISVFSIKCSVAILLALHRLATRDHQGTILIFWSCRHCLGAFVCALKQMLFLLPKSWESVCLAPLTLFRNHACTLVGFHLCFQKFVKGWACLQCRRTLSEGMFSWYWKVRFGFHASDEASVHGVTRGRRISYLLQQRSVPWQCQPSAAPLTLWKAGLMQFEAASIKPGIVLRLRLHQCWGK